MQAYIELWLRYCKENNIWWAACGDGSLYEVTDTEYGETIEPDARLHFGSRKAYEWLVRWHTELKTDTAAALAGRE